MVCWTRFPLCGKCCCFLIGNMIFCKMGNAFSKPYKYKWKNLGEWLLSQNPGSLVSMLFSIGIPERRKSKFLGYETQCYEGRKSRSADRQIASPNWCQKWFPQNPGSFPLDIHALFEWNSCTPENKFLHYETQCYEGRKSGSANHCFRQSKRAPKLISRKVPLHFHCVYKWFPIANSGNRKCHLVTTKSLFLRVRKLKK